MDKRKKQYEIRDCSECKRPIPSINKNGKHIHKSRYDQKETCGNPACVGSLVIKKRGWEYQQGYKRPITRNYIPALKKPIDYFIYGLKLPPMFYGILITWE